MGKISYTSIWQLKIEFCLIIMDFSTNNWRKIVIFWFTLRFITPLYIFINPGIGTAASVFLDAVDGYFSFKAKKTWEWYHTLDKLADYWWYILIVVYSYVTHLPIFGTLLVLFLYRSIGQFISLRKKESWMLIFFPNILENYFIAYLIFGRLMLVEPISLYIWMVCIAFAFAREYVLHIKKAYAANYIFKLGINWDLNKETI